MAYIGNSPVQDETVTSAQIVDGAIVDADINSSAAIAFSKMANLTASRLLVSDGSGDVSVSNVTSAEALLLDGGTSATSTTLAAADRLIVNDNGTIVQVALSDFETFFEGAIDTLSSAMTFSSTVTVGSDGSGQDVTFYSGTSGDSFVWDSSEEKLTITGTNGQTALDVADGNLVVADNIDLEGDIDVNGTANLDVVDIDGAVDMASTLQVDGAVRLGSSAITGWGSADELVIENTSANAGINILTGTSGTGYIAFGDSGDAGEATLGFTHGSTGKFSFGANGNTIMTMQDDVKVGIGTTSPGTSSHNFGGQHNLTLGGATTNSFSVLEIAGNDADDNAYIGVIEFVNKNNSDAASGTAEGISAISTVVQTDDTNAGDDSGGEMQFWTKALAGNLAERMRIDSDGNVGIGISPIHSDYKVSINTATNKNVVFTSAVSETGNAITLQGVNDDASSLVDLGFRANNFIFADGKVGLGTTSPDYTLDVEKSVTGDWLARVLNTATSSNPSGLLVRVDDADSTGILLGANASGTYRFVVKPDGKVGIGTASPQDTLDVYAGADGNSGMRITSTGSGTGSVTYLDLVHADGNYRIQNQADEFGIYDLGASATRMSIASDGTITHENATFAKAAVRYGVNSTNNGIIDGSTGSGSATLYIGNQSITTSSDIRIKENVVDTEVDALSKISALRVVDFSWNDPSDKSFNNKNARGKWTGLIAQEVIDHVPYVVNAVRDEETLQPIVDSKNEDGSDLLWGMEYDKLVPVLIKAVQELSAKVEALENA